MSVSRPSGEPGFVLVNALILVAALAAVATLLLARSEGARARLAETQSAAQIGLYLDAFEALTLSVLDADQRRGAGDDLSEAWARAYFDVPLDRGEVSGKIEDLQGRFNINWLTNRNTPEIWESFYRLLNQLALPPQMGDQIAKYLDQSGASDRSLYTRQTPAILPVGGPVLLIEQLHDIPTLTPGELERLMPFLSALPGDVPLNVNTASPEVLMAMVPGLRRAVLDRLMQSRRAGPFVSIEDFVDRLADAGAPGILDEAKLGRFSIGSSWFEARVTARLEGRERHRVTRFERQPLPVGATVAYRLTAAR